MRPQAMVQPKQAALVTRWGLAVAGARLVHGLGGDLAGVLELDVAVVAGGQGADLVDHVHQDLGAELGQTLAGDGVVGEDLLLLRRDLEELGEVADAGQPLVPRMATALRFFEPITAPTPERPAARCRSLTMQA